MLNYFQRSKNATKRVGYNIIKIYQNQLDLENLVIDHYFVAVTSKSEFGWMKNCPTSIESALDYEVNLIIMLLIEKRPEPGNLLQGIAS